jgi:hypothetical protein
MLAHQSGLTETYNRFHDPLEKSADILRLRELQVEMDKSAFSAYRWEKVDLGYGFHETKQGIRFTISASASRIILKRLLALNHERYNEETHNGLHEKKETVGKRKSSESKLLKSAAQGKLL